MIDTNTLLLLCLDDVADGLMECLSFQRLCDYLSMVACQFVGIIISFSIGIRVRFLIGFHYT